MSFSQLSEREVDCQSRPIWRATKRILGLACSIVLSLPAAALCEESPSHGIAVQENDSADVDSEQLANLENALRAFDESGDSENLDQLVAEALRLFKESIQPLTRQRSYEILKRFDSRELPNLVRTVRIKVPNVSCYGRFLDALHSRVRDESIAIHEITIVNTGSTRLTRKLSEFPLGTDAELSIVIDASRSDREVLDCLVTAFGAEVMQWRIDVEVSIEQLLSSDRNHSNAPGSRPLPPNSKTP